MNAEDESFSDIYIYKPNDNLDKDCNETDIQIPRTKTCTCGNTINECPFHGLPIENLNTNINNQTPYQMSPISKKRICELDNSEYQIQNKRVCQSKNTNFYL